MCRATFDPDTIASRLRELAFLNNAATIRFKATQKGRAAAAAALTSGTQTNGTSAAASSSDSSDSDNEDIDESDDGWQVFHYSAGLLEYVKWLNSDKQAFHEPIVVSREVRLPLGSARLWGLLTRVINVIRYPQFNVKGLHLQCLKRSDAAHGQLQLVQLLHEKGDVCMHEQQLTQETIDEKCAKQTANRMLLTHQSARADRPPHSPIILYLRSMLQCLQVLTADKQSDIGLWSTGGWCQGGSSFTMVQ